ncbi:TIGR01777 family oxidoreductase [Methylohalobius crimeensis]|uniref:TIGR01777 family oxidoreductase n=1 Tax=Methylohalobius crimeensis TaxID=244365 RepID=UPI0003B305F5|nr:TIGR01777 family oxidoreductase [Methylohalobius crimeensis]
MQIFITGGTGFIGRHLCQSLHTQNHSLTVLSRQADSRVRAICGEVAVVHSLDDLTPDHRFDAIVNLAGAPIIGPRWTERRKQVLWDSRVTLTERLVDWIDRAEAKPGVLVSGSAVGYYGDQGDRILDEETPPVAEGFGHRLCAAWEQAATKAEDHGVRVCRLRTAPVIGKNGGILSRMLFPFKLGLGGRIGDGRQWMSWSHLDDHVRMTERLLEDGGLSGPFNAAAPESVTNAEFTATLARLLHRPAFMPIPAMGLKLVMGEMAEILLASQRAIPKRFQEAGFQFRYSTLEEALEDVLAAD